MFTLGRRSNSTASVASTVNHKRQPSRRQSIVSSARETPEIGDQPIKSRASLASKRSSIKPRASVRQKPSSYSPSASRAAIGSKPSRAASVYQQPSTVKRSALKSRYDSYI